MEIIKRGRPTQYKFNELKAGDSYSILVNSKEDPYKVANRVRVALIRYISRNKLAWEKNVSVFNNEVKVTRIS